MFLQVFDNSTINSIGQFISVILIFIFVLFITYFTTRWIAKYQQGNIVNKNIKVIETYKLTTNKYIQFVKIGSKYIAIAIGKDNVEKLVELTEDEIETFQIDNGFKNEESFSKIFDRIKNIKSKK